MKIIYKYTIDVKQGSDLTVEMPEKYNILNPYKTSTSAGFSRNQTIID